ncbi:hypothetical protein BaRGS_00039587 [Batillaria attramentaria]|uniref:Uncharacterized protein n=1 Tax=Batillaria attramentaria TaxID=370345 RepID=A0ABD0J2G3_9CAEN
MPREATSAGGRVCSKAECSAGSRQAKNQKFAYLGTARRTTISCILPHGVPVDLKCPMKQREPQNIQKCVKSPCAVSTSNRWLRALSANWLLASFAPILT